MHRYRLELLGYDKGLLETREITCVDDDEAMLRASAFVHPHGIVVWQGHRRVAEIPAPETSSDRIR